MSCVIIGAGGHGRVVLDILRAADSVHVAGFVDANTELVGTEICGLPVLAAINGLTRLKQQKIRSAVVAIGDNRVRVRYAQLVIAAGLQLINAIHPRAIVSPGCVLGTNIVVAAGAVLCTETKLADSVIANTGCVIDHECEIGAGSHVCPGAMLAGRVRVGAGVFIGLGARVLPCLSIGSGAIVGAGATVIEDVPANLTVVGTPARALRKAA